jgi:hypothetical protein
MDEENLSLEILRLLALLAAFFVSIIGPLWWTVYRVLRPVDRAARERNMPFRFSLGDFLCLFWIVQLPLAFVYRLGDDRDGDADLEQFYWILTAAVWIVAPLAWFTVARALSRAGVAAGLHRMLFLGLVLPTVYYGLFPFIGMSIAGVIGIGQRGIAFFLENKFLTALWCVLVIGLIAGGFYSPWMIRRTRFEEVDSEIELLREGEAPAGPDASTNAAPRERRPLGEG